MIDRDFYKNALALLESELKPALGCTEPIAIAFAAAKARSVLGCLPETMEVCCSGNIIKNVKGVYTPHSGGMKGIDTAAILGMLAACPEKELEVLEAVTPEDVETAKKLREQGMCRCTLKEGVANLYILVTVRAGDRSASVELQDYHTNITRITRDGTVLYEKSPADSGTAARDAFKESLTLESIVEFARRVDGKDVQDLLDRQIQMNAAIAEEGLRHPYGGEIGRTLLAGPGEKDVRVHAMARAAAGSDARMNGCAMPVVINSGSGNQGITASMPVLTYWEHLGASREQLYRALVISNLVAVHQKTYIGSLSAYCGAVCAAAGSAAGITFLQGGSDEQIGNAVVNTVANIGGMVCDGAKSSCAAKISSAVEAAILGSELSLRGYHFSDGDGIVKETPEETIKSVGRMGREGMRSTDVEILHIMLGS